MPYTRMKGQVYEVAIYAKHFPAFPKYFALWPMLTGSYQKAGEEDQGAEKII